MGSWKSSAVPIISTAVGDADMESSASVDHFANLYQEFSPLIFNLCYKMTGSRQDAEDILQKTFMQAYLSMDGFREESKISTWLYVIARNLCYQHLNQKKRNSFRNYHKLIIDTQFSKPPESLTRLETDYYISQVREGCLLGLLRCLPMQQRLAFILRVLLRLDIKTVADILGKSESAVRILAHRARKSIKEFLCEHCSLYQSGKPCSCENFINFSIARGWIHCAQAGQTNQTTMLDVDAIACDIDELKKITLLYSSIPGYDPSDQLVQRLKDAISKQDKMFFSARKVKQSGPKPL